MKKMFLLLGLLIVFIFLVSCTNVGEAFQIKTKAISLPADNIDLKIPECSRLANECGFIKDSELKAKIKEVMLSSEIREVNGYFGQRSCNDACADAGKSCLSALRGYSGVDLQPPYDRAGQHADWDHSVMRAQVSCSDDASPGDLIFCTCI